MKEPCKDKGLVLGAQSQYSNKINENCLWNKFIFLPVDMWLWLNGEPCLIEDKSLDVDDLGLFVAELFSFLCVVVVVVVGRKILRNFRIIIRSVVVYLTTGQTSEKNDIMIAYTIVQETSSTSDVWLMRRLMKNTSAEKKKKKNELLFLSLFSSFFLSLALSSFFRMWCMCRSRVESIFVLFCNIR